MNSATTSQPEAIDFDRLAMKVKERPLRALTLSAGAGFVLGGGLRSRMGLALGLFIGRSFAGTALVNAIEALSDQSDQNGRQHRPNQGRTGRSAAKPSSNRD
jgi:hypothetical protein